MAPKEPFKVHSLSKHIENTNKGLSAEAQYNRRTLSRPPPVKKEPGAIDKSIFGNDDDSDGDDSSGSESSGDDGGAEFLRKLYQPAAKSATKPAAPKRPGNNLEIADSDAERNKKAKPVIKPEHDSSDDASGDSESDKSQKPKADANGAAANKESSSGSDSSSDSDSDEKNEPGNAKMPAAGETPESTSSESETSDSSSDESESESEAATTSIKTKLASKPAVNGNAAKSTSSSDDSSSHEGESAHGHATESSAPKKETVSSSSSSSASAADSDQEMADESIHMEDRQVGGQVAPPSVISPDFVLRKSGDGVSGEDVARICSQANMQGKQFWYFTVPSGVPISVVQNLEIPMDASQRGDRAFSHGGEDFGISFDSMVPKSSIQILIPSADGSHYQAASQRIDEVMQVRRITQLGANGSTVGPSENNAPRPQPKGLKARYQPIGVDTPVGKTGADSGSDGEDCEMADAPALSSARAAQPEKSPAKTQPEKSAPKAQPDKSTPKSKKGKRKETPVRASQEATAPRSGKRKQPSSEDEAAAAASQLMEESQTAESKTKKPKTDRGGSPDLGFEPPLSATRKAKQTPVMPPKIPMPTQSITGLGSTPAAASSPLTGKVKKPKKVKGEQPVPSSSQSLPPAKKDTPVPIPRQTVVPVPLIPSSSQQPKISPVPIPLPAAAATSGRVLKGKTSRDGAANAAGTGSSQPQTTLPPASAQSSEKKKKKKKKQTPVGAPESEAPA